MPPKKKPAVDKHAAAVAAARAAKAQRRRGWLAAVTLAALVAAAWIDQASRAPDRTIPRVHKMANCDPTAEADARHILMCRGAAAHNSALLTQFHEQAKQGLMVDGDERKWMHGEKASLAMANALADYYIALAMRNHEYFELQEVLVDFLKHTQSKLACTKLIDLSEWTSESLWTTNFKLPPILCTEAVFVEGKKKKDLEPFLDNPTEFMKTTQRMVFLYSLLGSNFHEAAVAYTAVIPISDKRVTVDTPSFSPYATKTYLLDSPKSQMFELMTLMWKTPKVAHPIVATIVDKIVANFNLMCAKYPEPTATWNETFFATVPNYNRTGYAYATRNLAERFYDTYISRMRRINADVFKASIKHSVYITAVLFVSSHFFSDVLPSFLLHWWIFPLTFALTEYLLWSLVTHWKDCPLFTLFPELKSDV